jgi:hypothetical protein
MKMDSEKPLTWADIENSFKNSIRQSPGETDNEKLDYFKKKILAYLDNLQAEQDKKVISLPRSMLTGKKG